MKIVTAADDKYVPGVMALLYSTWLHNEDVELYVLDNGIGASSKCRLNKLSDIMGHEINLIDISGSEIIDIELPDNRLTVSAYGRLLIPEIFKDSDRVLYLDCDMLVTGSLCDLYATDLGSSVAGVVHDYGPGLRELSDVGVSSDKYFNSGLILFDIKNWLKNSITEKCFEEVSRKVYRYHDQSVLNIVCQGKVTYLPENYNIFVDIPPERRREANMADIKVLHYVGPKKPWLFKPLADNDAAVVYTDIWHSYVEDFAELVKSSECYQEVPRKSGISLYISYLNRRRRVWMGRLLGKKKYIRRADAVKFVRTYLPQIKLKMLADLERSKKGKYNERSAYKKVS